MQQDVQNELTRLTYTNGDEDTLDYATFFGNSNVYRQVVECRNFK